MLSFILFLSVIIAPQSIYARSATNEEIVAACGPATGTPENMRCVEAFLANFDTSSEAPDSSASSNRSGGGGDSSMLNLLNPLTWITAAAGNLSILALKIASLLTYLSGIILNYVVWYTVVTMKDNMSNAGAIDASWKVIRDICNIAFIFILLYASIETILGVGKNVKDLIVRIIVVAVLINFSLFFTKFVIDVSNLMAMTFYDAIAPGALSASFSTGLSNSLMESLKINTIWETLGFSGTDLLVVGVMGTIVTLIAAFVFFAISLLLIIRFVVLIFVLILSPIAFIAYILPQAEKYREQWKDALIGQAFFAPIYFMLTWVVILLSRNLFTTTNGSMASAIIGVNKNGTTTHDPSSIGILVNFMMLITLLITSLVIAKEWANKVPGGMSKLTNWATATAGSTTLGIAGRFGRGTIGRAGQAIAENEWLKDKAPNNMVARLGLAASRKTAGASFDVRSAGWASQLDAGKGQKGGFSKDMDEKIKAEKKFADSLKPSEIITSRADKALDAAKKTGDVESIRIAQAEVDRLKGADEEEMRKREVKRIREKHYDDTGVLLSEKVIKQNLEKEENKRRVLIKELKRGGLSHEEATARAKEVSRENGGWAPEAVKSVSVKRKENYAKDKETSTTFKIPVVGIPLSFTGRVGLVGKVKRERQEEAIAMRKSIKEKKPAEKIAEQIKAETEAAADSTPTPEPTTPPATPNT